jgi:hypothetical protein
MQNHSLNIVAFISERQSLEADLWHMHTSLILDRSPVSAYPACSIIFLPPFPVGTFYPSLMVESWQIKFDEWFWET